MKDLTLSELIDCLAVTTERMSALIKEGKFTGDEFNELKARISELQEEIGKRRTNGEEVT